MFLLAYGLANFRPNKEAKTLCRHNIQLTAHSGLGPMHTNWPTAQHNPNPDIKHFKAERWCSSYCAIKHLHQSWIFMPYCLSYERV